MEPVPLHLPPCAHPDEEWPIMPCSPLRVAACSPCHGSRGAALAARKPITCLHLKTGAAQVSLVGVGWVAACFACGQGVRVHGFSLSGPVDDRVLLLNAGGAYWDGVTWRYMLVPPSLAELTARMLFG